VSSLSRRAAATVGRLAARGGTASVDVSGGRRVEISYGAVRLHDRRAGTRAGPAAAATVAVNIEGPGAYRWPAAGVLEVREGGRAGAARSARGAHEFDADRLGWPLVMRARRPGDRMRPRGGRGSRKLSDLMIDAKIARPTREALPLVVTADGVVLFVPGLRPAEAGCPSPTTQRRITIFFRRAMSTFPV
jgi:tRNA(Ile)-lysidine synthase